MPLVKEKGSGVLLVPFYDMQHLYTQNSLPIIPSKCLDEGFQKRVISCCLPAERMRFSFSGMCAPLQSKSIVGGYQGNI